MNVTMAIPLALCSSLFALRRYHYDFEVSYPDHTPYEALNASIIGKYF